VGRPDRFRAQVISLAVYVTRDYRESLGLWLAAAIAIAILCAVNFTTMSLARGMRRRGEIAVRAAMGASPKRLITILALEGAFTALGGGVLSVVMASALIAYSRLWIGASLPVPPTIDWRTVVFGIAVTTLMGALCALAPAVDLSKADLRSIIAGGASTATAGGRELRGRRGLVALQIALALATVAVVTSLVQADRRMERFGPGYDYSSIVAGDVTVVDSTAQPGLSTRVRDFFIAAPGVSNATVVRTPSSEATGITPDFKAPEAFMNWQDVDADFFTTLGVHPVSGRLPTAEEVAHHAPVMVLSETTVLFAHFRVANIDPIGHRIRLRTRGKPAAWYTVIGVVPDVRFAPNFAPLSPAVYTFGSAPSARRILVFAKLRGDPGAQMRSLSGALGGLDSRILVSNLKPVAQQVDEWRALSGARTLFLGLVAALALLLAIVGVFGLTSFTAELRLREIGVRIALGASRQGLMRVIAGELWWMGCIGIAAGYLISMRVASLLDAQFANPLLRTPVVTFQVAPTAISAVALLVITAIGTFVPLRRALRIDVMRALQSG
jgi:predicted permease